MFILFVHGWTLLSIPMNLDGFEYVVQICHLYDISMNMLMVKPKLNTLNSTHLGHHFIRFFVHNHFVAPP
jgi:hypothetical protein